MAIATTEVAVCNLALSLLKQPPITALTGTDAVSKACNQHFARMRDEVLTKLPWHFAVKRAELTQSSTDPTFGFDYQFDVPTDCLRLLMHDTEDNTETEPTWKREGAYILTNETEFEAVYIYRNTTVAEWSEDFVTTLTYRLAAELAMILATSEKLFSAFMSIYQSRLAEAGGYAMKEMNVTWRPRHSGTWSKR